VGTLEWMAHAARGEGADILCPMIDARRDEVFTALYDREGREKRPPFSVILDRNSFGTELASGRVHFFGDGAEKFSRKIQNANAIFTPVSPGSSHLSEISRSRFHQTLFSNIAYFEPLYVKEFHTPPVGRKTV